MSAPAVKVCGLTRRADAEAVVASGARYAGAVFAPGGRRSVSAERVAELFEGLAVLRVGVFVDASAAQMEAAAEASALDVLQLHGDEPLDVVRALRRDGGWTLWKAVRVRSVEAFDRAADRYGPEVDGLLLDGWSPDAPGGTGTRFDWDALALHRARLPSSLQLIVAGGLRATNVGRAIDLLRPAVVDVSSGVESAPGVKDAAAVSAFIAAVRGAGEPARHPQ